VPHAARTARSLGIRFCGNPAVVLKRAARDANCPRALRRFDLYPVRNPWNVNIA